MGNLHRQERGAMLRFGRLSETGERASISSEIVFSRKGCGSMIPPMRLPPTLAWLVDKAGTMRGADQFLATLGAKLIADGLPLAGGALTLTAAHPIIARRTWLWRAETGAVIEALGFASPGPAGRGGGAEPGKVGRDWLAGLGTGLVQEEVAGPSSDGPVLAWAVSRPLAEPQSALLHQAARFAAAPLAGLGSRAALAALLEAYLGRRSAAQVLAGRSRRETGETIRAALLFGDLRGFTELSESMAADAVVAALDAWFDRIAGAVHAFGGEVLKFIGDGVLAIFPIGERPASVACDAALSAVAAAQAGMAHLDQARLRQGLPSLQFGLALHLGDMLWGNVGTADRLDFTAIGPAVNLVSRLEGLCRPLGRNVLVSGAVAAETTAALVPLGEHRLRGIAAPCAVFTLPQE
jgi:adenylate cyclase